MGRRERTIHSSDGPVAQFALELRRLRESAGRPTYREMASRTDCSVTVLAEAAGGNRFPTLAVTLAFVEACGGDRTNWEEYWHSLAAELRPSRRARNENHISPYLGLSTFQKVDKNRFFGREELVIKLRDRIMTTTLLAVSGPSGSGKSSLIRAGLLPTLVGRGRAVRSVLTTPGRQPLAALAKALGVTTNLLSDTPEAIVEHIRGRRRSTTRLLIVIDQFEELFTTCQDERERSRFIALVLTITALPDPGIHFLLGLRADFTVLCANHPELISVLQDRTVPIGPIDLRSVIVGPAAAVGVTIEEELVERVIADAAEEPGSLPLVSYTLQQAWKRRSGQSLTLAAYLEIDDIRGAVTQLGENAFNQLDAEQRRLASELFLRLTTIGEGATGFRRHVPHDELLADTDREAMSAAIEYLAKARLITIDDMGITIAHEVIIRGWPRLQTWLTENRLHELERALKSADDNARRRKLILAAVAIIGTATIFLILMLNP